LTKGLIKNLTDNQTVPRRLDQTPYRR